MDAAAVNLAQLLAPPGPSPARGPEPAGTGRGAPDFADCLRRADRPRGDRRREPAPEPARPADGDRPAEETGEALDRPAAAAAQGEGPEVPQGAEPCDRAADGSETQAAADPPTDETGSRPAEGGAPVASMETGAEAAHAFQTLLAAGTPPGGPAVLVPGDDQARSPRPQVPGGMEAKSGAAGATGSAIASAQEGTKAGPEPSRAAAGGDAGPNEAATAAGVLAKAVERPGPADAPARTAGGTTRPEAAEARFRSAPGTGAHAAGPDWDVSAARAAPVQTTGVPASSEPEGRPPAGLSAAQEPGSSAVRSARAAAGLGTGPGAAGAPAAAEAVSDAPTGMEPAGSHRPAHPSASGTVADQVAEGFRVALGPEGVRSASGTGGGVQEVVVRLFPPELGRVRIAVRSEEGALRGEVRVETPETLSRVQEEAVGLVHRLRAEGIDLRRLDVSLAPQTGTGGRGSALAGDPGAAFADAGAEGWTAGDRGQSPRAAPAAESEAPRAQAAAALTGPGCLDVRI